MKVKVKFFAIFRDVVGKKEITLSFRNELTVAKLLKHIRNSFPEINRYIDEYEIEPIIVLVNGKPATEKTTLNDGDEVAIFPPAAGGIGVGKIVKHDVSLEAIINDMRRNKDFEKAGAVVIFIGFVKGIVEGKKVYSLSYEAYEPYATKKLQEIADDALRREGVIDVRIYHKVMKLKPKETTVYIVVAATNRQIAFDVARDILERVKKEAPIWKLEVRDDGEYWIIGDGKRIPRPKKR